MFDLEVSASSKLVNGFKVLNGHVLDLAEENEERLGLTAILMLSAARRLTGENNPSGNIVIGNLTIGGKRMGDVSIKVDWAEPPAEPVPEPEVKRTGMIPKARLPKTSIPPKKPPVPKQAEAKKPARKQPTKLIQVGPDDFVDTNGVHFNAAGQAIGSNGKPTANPYRTRVPADLDPDPKPVRTVGGTSIHGSYDNTEF